MPNEHYVDQAGDVPNRRLGAIVSTGCVRGRGLGHTDIAMERHASLPVNEIVCGDCVEVMSAWPEATFDLIFADPPYNLQLRDELWRPNQSRVDAVDDAWDKIGGFQEYDRFSRAWLLACRRLLKPDGAIWVIGTYHNIFRLGAIMQDLGFWFLNDVVWVKTNPMPNFHGVRLTNAHETLIWAARSDRSRYTFHHHTAKLFNGGKQLRSDWLLPLCSGAERLRERGRKVHSTQKPEALLERIIAISTRPDALILDPFFGSGTTGAVARRLHRRWIGIEREPLYVQAARERIAAVRPAPVSDPLVTPEVSRGQRVRIPFAALLAGGLLRPGQELYFRREPGKMAVITDHGRLRLGSEEASIHGLAKRLSNGAPCNGWEHWYFAAEDGSLQPIDVLRERLRRELPAEAPPEGLTPIRS